MSQFRSQLVECASNSIGRVLDATLASARITRASRRLGQNSNWNRLGPTWKLRHEHQVKDDLGRVTGYTALEKIGQTLEPILIRRRRSEVLKQLPSRTDQNLLVPMTAPQCVHHKENADVVAQIVNRWRRTKLLSDKEQRRLTCALQNMRMSCNSTYLLDQETEHGVKADDWRRCWTAFSSNPTRRRWSSASGHAPTTSSSAGWT